MQDATPEMVARLKTQGESLDPWKTAINLIVEMEPSS
jgi:hypothetical protein